jgi:hypothetical protein
VDAGTEELLDRLAAWQRAGLLTHDQAAAIATHERRRVRGEDATPRLEATPAAREPAARNERTTAAEAIGYVGAALVLGAIGLFVGEFWDVLTTGGQLALALLLTVALAGAAAALRGATSPALSRLTSVLSAGSIAGLAWSTTIVTDGLLTWSGQDVALAVGVVTVATSLPLYLVRPRALPQLTLLASSLVLVLALLARAPLPLGSFWLALPVAGLGVVWLLLGEGGYLQPRRVAATVGGALAVLALQVGAFDDLRLVALLLALVLAGVLVALAVFAGGLHHLAVGAVGLFLVVPQLVFELFGDAIGAPATLLLVGILLVLLAVGLGRARREVAPLGGAS